MGRICTDLELHRKCRSPVCQPFPAHWGLAGHWVGASRAGRARRRSGGCRGWASLLTIPKQPWAPALAGGSPPTSSQGSCRRQAGGEVKRLRSISIPAPILSSLPGQHWDAHILTPQPDPAPCRDTNPPGDTRTGDPEPRGPHCMPSWPRTPGLSLEVGVGYHMWPCPGWPWLLLPKSMSPESSTQVWELPCTQGYPTQPILAWPRLRYGQNPASPAEKGLRGRQT